MVLTWPKGHEAQVAGIEDTPDPVCILIWLAQSWSPSTSQKHVSFHQPSISGIWSFAKECREILREKLYAATGKYLQSHSRIGLPQAAGTPDWPSRTYWVPHCPGSVVKKCNQKHRLSCLPQQKPNWWGRCWCKRKVLFRCCATWENSELQSQRLSHLPV